MPVNGSIRLLVQFLVDKTAVSLYIRLRSQKMSTIPFRGLTLGVVVEVVEGRARELRQVAGSGGVDAGPPVEVLGAVRGVWKNELGLEILNTNLSHLVNAELITKGTIQI